jgi:segregation and condensation protein A
VLRLDAFEGRLDWLLELARGHRVDLARPSLVEIADQLILALDEAAGERDSGDGASLPRRSEWVVMGATLAELRSRLLLPEDTVAGRPAKRRWRCATN